MVRGRWKRLYRWDGVKGDCWKKGEGCGSRRAGTKLQTEAVPGWGRIGGGGEVEGLERPLVELG